MNRTAAVRIAGSLCLLGCLSCGSDPGTTPSQAPGPSPTGQTGSPQPGPPAPSLTDLFAAVERDPGNPEAHHGLAVGLHSAGRREESIAHFEVITQLTPEPRHLVELGVAYASVSRFEDAEATLERAIEAEPGQPVVLHHLGNLANRRGDSSGAIELYRQAIEAEPTYLMAQFHLAQTLKGANDLQEAYRAFERVLELEPRDPIQLQAFDESLFQLGSLDLQMGATERAIEFFDLLIEKVPVHPKAHRALGDALTKLGRIEDAAAEYETHRRLTTAAQL
jgi:tetratricopeptide (TPR) repeat protein